MNRDFTRSTSGERRSRKSNKKSRKKESLHLLSDERSQELSPKEKNERAEPADVMLPVIVQTEEVGGGSDGGESKTSPAKKRSAGERGKGSPLRRSLSAKTTGAIKRLLRGRSSEDVRNGGKKIDKTASTSSDEVSSLSSSTTEDESKATTTSGAFRSGSEEQEPASDTWKSNNPFHERSASPVQTAYRSRLKRQKDAQRRNKQCLDGEMDTCDQRFNVWSDEEGADKDKDNVQQHKHRVQSSSSALENGISDMRAMAREIKRDRDDEKRTSNGKRNQRKEKHYKERKTAARGSSLSSNTQEQEIKGRRYASETPDMMKMAWDRAKSMSEKSSKDSLLATDCVAAAGETTSSNRPRRQHSSPLQQTSGPDAIERTGSENNPFATDMSLHKAVSEMRRSKSTRRQHRVRSVSFAEDDLAPLENKRTESKRRNRENRRSLQVTTAPSAHSIPQLLEQTRQEHQQQTQSTNPFADNVTTKQPAAKRRMSDDYLVSDSPKMASRTVAIGDLMRATSERPMSQSQRIRQDLPPLNIRFSKASKERLVEQSKSRMLTRKSRDTDEQDNKTPVNLSKSAALHRSRTLGAFDGEFRRAVQRFQGMTPRQRHIRAEADRLNRAMSIDLRKSGIIRPSPIVPLEQRAPPPPPPDDDASASGEYDEVPDDRDANAAVANSSSTPSKRNASDAAAATQGPTDSQSGGAHGSPTNNEAGAPMSPSTAPEGNMILYDIYGFQVPSGFYHRYKKWFRRRERNKELVTLPFSQLKHDCDDNGNQLRVRIRMLNHLFDEGVPENHRGHMWQVLMDVEEKKTTSWRRYYERLREECSDTNASSWDLDPGVVHQIEIDLDRTFPTRKQDYQPGFKDKLREVLLCYALHNKSVGYAQSMNYITGALLIFMEPEPAFWCLRHIAEELLPGYYSGTLHGVVIDINVLDVYIRNYLPHLYKHFEKHSFTIMMIANQWFSTLFFNNLPAETVFRIWDLLFANGVCVLFEYALRLLHHLQPKLMKETDLEGFMDVIIKRSQSIYNFHWLSDIPIDPPIHNAEIKVFRDVIRRRIERSGGDYSKFVISAI